MLSDQRIATVAALVLVAFMAACGTLTGYLSGSDNANIDKAAKQLADGYCKQPEATRVKDSRPRINLAIAPHKLKMDCYGDADNPIIVPVTPK
jgi:hypothetical protein